MGTYSIHNDKWMMKFAVVGKHRRCEVNVRGILILSCIACCSSAGRISGRSSFKWIHVSPFRCRVSDTPGFISCANPDELECVVLLL